MDHLLHLHCKARQKICALFALCMQHPFPFHRHSRRQRLRAVPRRETAKPAAADLQVADDAPRHRPLHHLPRYGALQLLEGARL